MNQLETLRAKGNLLRPTKKKPGRKWLRKASPKRRIALELYRGESRKFLARHNRCQACFGPCCTGKVQDLHHRAGRIGAALLDQKNWLAVCRPCHDAIHRHPSVARFWGLLK